MFKQYFPSRSRRWGTAFSWGMFGLIALKTAFDFLGVRKDAKGDPAKVKGALKTREAYAALDNQIKARFSKPSPPQD